MRIFLGLLGLGLAGCVEGPPPQPESVESVAAQPAEVGLAIGCAEDSLQVTWRVATTDNVARWELNATTGDEVLETVELPAEGEGATALSQATADGCAPCTVQLVAVTVSGDRTEPIMVVEANTDADEDGFGATACGGTDCADDDPAVNTEAAEACDEVDNDCNGVVDDVPGAPLAELREHLLLSFFAHRAGVHQ